MTMSYIVEHKIKGHTYVYQSTAYWDKEKKQSRNKRIYLGKKDPKTGKIIPSKQNPKVTSCKDYGNFYFLNSIAKEIGLIEVLSKSFLNIWEQILMCAFFEVSERKPMYLCELWIESTHSTLKKKLSSQRISELLKIIGESTNERIEFSKIWGKKREEKEYVAFDITSISSYSKLNEWIEYGYNRDKEKLPQINLGMLFGQSSLLPIFYNIYQGSIRDVSTLKNMIKFIEHLELERVTFVFDKGFYSLENLTAMRKKRIKYIISMPFTVNNAKNLINSYGKKVCSVSNSFRLNKQILYGLTVKTRIGGNYLNAYIFFDKRKRLEAEEHFIKKLVEVEDKIREKQFKNKTESEKYLKQKFPAWKNYFNIKKVKRQFIFERDEEEVKEVLKHKGYLIILSNSQIEYKEVISLYRNKDAVEKSFDNLKNELDIKRLRVHSKETMDGRLFIGFIALILYSWISKIMKENNLFNSYTVEEVMRELKKIKLIELNNDRKIITELSKRQKKIVRNIFLNTP